MAYKSHCLFCKKTLNDKHTAYSVCYDPCWKENVWGGDSHQYIGYLCDECGEEMSEEAGSVKDE